MVEINVNAGVCGFCTNIKADSEDMQTVNLDINTECPSLKPLETELKEVDGFVECFAKVGESSIYEVSKKYCRHAACPVPCAIIKGVEVASGLALKKDAEIKFVNP